MLDPLKEVDTLFDTSLDHVAKSLRPIPKDELAFQQATEWLLSKLSTDLPTLDQARVLSRIGAQNMVLGNLDMAEQQLSEAQQMVENEDVILKTVNLVRLATNHQYKK